MGESDFFSREGQPFKRAKSVVGVGGVKPRMASPPPNGVMIMRELERKAKWK